MDYSLPGSSVHGIFQARVLEWVTIAFSNDKHRQHIKVQRHYFVDKGPSSQSYGFSSSRECWTIKKTTSKNWCFWTSVLEKTLESPLDCKVVKPVNPKGNQSWIIIRRTDSEGETPILWLPDVKNWLFGKDPDAGKDWGQEEKGITEDKMVGWHHWLDGYEFEQAPEVGDGQGSLACCSLWGCKEPAMTEWLNWTDWLTDNWHEISYWGYEYVLSELVFMVVKLPIVKHWIVYLKQVNFMLCK